MKTNQTPVIDGCDCEECKCWSNINRKLWEQGYKLSDACSMLQITDQLGLRAIHGMPLQRVDGAKLKRDDPRILEISYCPFCGRKHQAAAN